MTMHRIIDAVFLLLIVALLTYNRVLARRLRIDRIAREAEDALGPPHIGDIIMPEPSDPRWKREEKDFQDGKHIVLALGHVLVREGPLLVYIGPGEAIEGGSAYAKRVVHAWRQRLANESKGTP